MLEPNIWCNRSAEAVAALYEEAFGAAGFEVSSVVEARYPETDIPDFQKEFAGQPVTINVTINGYLLTLINAGDEFRPSPGVSFMLNFDPLMFDVPAQDRAEEAANLYVELFNHKNEQRAEAHIAEQHGHALDLMDLLWRSAMEAVNWGSEILHEHLKDDPEDDAYAALFTTLTGLAARALLAFNEVSWLLRGGYPQGAFTRVRSPRALYCCEGPLGIRLTCVKLP